MSMIHLHISQSRGRSWKHFVSVLLLQAVLLLAAHGHVQATGGATPTDPLTCGAAAPPVDKFSTKPQKLLNSAFLFVKPHANTEKVRELVTKKLESEGIKILSQLDIGGEEIDSKGLIDQHYYSIASKATILSADEIPVPKDMFLESFGEEWEDVLKDGRASNAIEACKRFECTPEELNETWRSVPAVKFGGGFYCGT